jgi:hypothetical protein
MSHCLEATEPGSFLVLVLVTSAAEAAALTSDSPRVEASFAYVHGAFDTHAGTKEQSGFERTSLMRTGTR